MAPLSDSTAAPEERSQRTTFATWLAPPNGSDVGSATATRNRFTLRCNTFRPPSSNAAGPMQRLAERRTTLECASRNREAIDRERFARAA